WARRAQRRSRVLPSARSRVAPHSDFMLRAVSHYAWFANDERRTMRAWTVDADDIRVAEDFDEALLHRTPEIEGFLSPDRDDKFIVIGTKGFGKTLLLKAKRVLYQREGNATCLPRGNLLDKPIGDKIFGREAIALFSTSPLPWSKLWLSAIALAVLKHVGAHRDLEVGAKLGSLVADAQLHSVIDHFVRLLDFTPSELQRAANDT